MCIEICKNKAIKQEEGKITLDKKICNNCGKCEIICPSKARVMIGTEMSVPETLKEIEKDMQFYRRSGGGVTFSGGEPVQYNEFVEEITYELKKRNIHVAIETTGYAPWGKFWSAVKDMDLILFDLKGFDKEVHKMNTGIDNELILNNAKEIASLKKVIFRIPIIPGYNNDESSLEKLSGFINECNPGGEVHIIPYHALGKSKYEHLRREYKLSEIKSPSNDDLSKLANIFTAKGLKTQVF